MSVEVSFSDREFDDEEAQFEVKPKVDNQRILRFLDEEEENVFNDDEENSKDVKLIGVKPSNV